MDAYSPDGRNVNALWASVLVETLQRGGVRRVVVSPGSRSTPLAMAAAGNAAVEAVPVLDERSAAFFALGLARGGAAPVALICTSGSAAANYFPAVIEASEGGGALVVLTADRPPELRACASGQTIDQQKIFGGYVEFFHELAVPELSEPRFRYLRQTVAHAVRRSRDGGGAPVHLNVPFRDPLAPVDDGGRAAAFAASIDWSGFFAHHGPDTAAMRVAAPLPQLMPSVHGVIVAGPAQPEDDRAYVVAVAEIARRLGWPVLADGASPLRHQASRVPHLVTTYDLILRQPELAERLKPEVVLCLGGWPASKVLRTWLEHSAAPTWLVTERRDNRDGLHGRTRSLIAPLPILAAALPEAGEDNGYERLWARFEREARPRLDARLEAEKAWFEPQVAWLLARHLPEGTPWCLANSMPIRDAEYVVPPGDRALRPFSSRGANGIDGTLSTAMGVAQATGRPTVLLTGDLAFLHDANGLLLRPKFRGSLTVVLVNNRGGGIFEHLPVAAFEPPFEEYFATPQEADIGRLCAAHGVEWMKVGTPEQLVSLVAELPPQGLRVLEVSTDRKRDAARRRQWFAELAATLVPRGA
ncbi:MAG: 2-succinyl-5-enolpyruvyl-6-hydroxy-3-cyclohexene-1-carboxylic-acid synthase [Verrucomicrobia bacterium]|nr:2-succinyl-5-enolpyruvyl-6-hydroxy-3-cyclohexene-1-carboxylic-acid synthase [Verrucomicrobiota bacterium]